MRRAVLTIAFAALVFAPAARAEIIAGGGVGQSNIEFDFDTDRQEFTFDEGDTGWKIHAGFRFLKFFGLGASYIELGAPEDTFEDVVIRAGLPLVDVDLETDAFAAGVWAEGVLPLGGRFELFGRLQYLYWDSEVAVTTEIPGVVQPGVIYEDDGWDVAWGAGAAFRFAGLLAIRLEYELFEVSETNSTSFASIGLDIRL